jgi:glycosyltransferase involved in cell wall biosynthesis
VTRIVHVVVAGEIGGAERMLVDLASRPRETRAKHVIALLTPNYALANALRAARVRVHDRGPVREGVFPFLWHSLGPSDVAWLATVLSTERAQVAHLHTFASQVIGTRAARRAAVRVLRTEHSTRAFDDPSCWPFSRWSLARADACVAVSDHVRSVARKRAPWAAKKLRVVPNGVDTARFAPRHSIRHERFTFVSVGRLERRKGLDLAIRALSRTRDARLEVIGDGEERGALQALAYACNVGDRVRFHGFVDDPREAVSTSDAALSSSRSEGLGVALLEAMAMGRPVVGFSVGGVREIVVHGLTGLLAREGDVDALAARMNQAVAARDVMRTFGEAARTRILERFSVRSMCEGYARAYSDLVGAAAKPAEKIAEDARDANIAEPSSRHRTL